LSVCLIKHNVMTAYHMKGKHNKCVTLVKRFHVTGKCVFRQTKSQTLWHTSLNNVEILQELQIKQGILLQNISFIWKCNSVFCV